MSVFIHDFNPGDGNWSVVHDDMGHTGTVDPNNIVYSQDIDGSPNHNYLIIVCPVCQSASTHPVGGGAQPPLVQEMFVRKVNRYGCVCPAMKDQPVTFSTAVEHIKRLVEEMDGPDRWQLDEIKLARELDVNE